MDFEKRFLQFCEEQELFSKNNRVLVGVSGGADSMVLAHLLLKSGHDVGLAHVNYNLRAQESDQDQEFVKEYANRNTLPFYQKQINPDAWEQKGSTQMLARDFRFQWFNELAKVNDYEWIAIGSSLTDNIETIFINLLRGTGIKGLTGMDAKSKMIIRPLLWATRDEIRKYAQINQIEFREDSSNASTKYLRNKLRHHILPLFRQENQQFEDVMMRNIKNLKMAQDFIETSLEKSREEIVSKRDQEVLQINLEKLRSKKAYLFVLYNILEEFNFTFDTTISLSDKNIITGKQFFSSTHEALIDRGQLLIRKRRMLFSKEVLIHELGEYEFDSNIIKIDAQIKKLPFGASKYLEQFDRDKLKFPLKLRKWTNGDRMIPLGMKTSKLVSDMLTDAKLSKFEKEKTLVIESNGIIVWLVGQRISELVKITPQTNNIISVSLSSKT